MLAYLFNIRSQTIAFTAAGDLSDQLIQLLLTQDAITFAFEDEARLLGNCRLTHHTSGAIARTTESRTRRTHRDWIGRWNAESAGDGELWIDVHCVLSGNLRVGSSVAYTRSTALHVGLRVTAVGLRDGGLMSEGLWDSLTLAVCLGNLS